MNVLPLVAPVAKGLTLHTMKTNLARLQAPRRNRARKLLAAQIKASAVPYQNLSDQESIEQYIHNEMIAYRLDLSFHEAAVLLGDETEANQPLMPPLLR